MIEKQEDTGGQKQKAKKCVKDSSHKML